MIDTTREKINQLHIRGTFKKVIVKGCFVLFCKEVGCLMVPDVEGKEGYQCQYLNFGPQQNATAIVLGWSYLEGGGLPGSRPSSPAEDPAGTPPVPGRLRDYRSERRDL